MKNQKGFTLVEIAVVLVIIGLLIGGVLRGQELITTARVRQQIDQITAVKTSYYGFTDRYRLYAGELTAAQASLVHPAASPALDTPGDNAIWYWESAGFFNNLTTAGFLICAPCQTRFTAPTFPSSTNSPANPYGHVIYVASQTGGNGNGGAYLTPGPAEGFRLRLSIGGQFEPRVLAEIDRKMDDGIPSTGEFRAGQTSWIPSLTTPIDTCVNRSVAPMQWQPGSIGQCGGVAFF